MITRSQGLDEEGIQRQVRITGGAFELFSQYGEDESFENRLKEYLQTVISEGKVVIPQGMNKDAFMNAQVSQFRNPWMRYFLKYDPVISLQRIKCPVLALNGEKDVQVAPENLAVIEKAVRQGGSNKVTVKEFPNMNHLFQTCKTGAIDEYATIELTIDPIVLAEISGWVLKQTK